MYKFLSWINERIFRTLKALIMFLLVAMSVMVFAQVVARFIGVSLAWSEELSTFCFSWLTYFGAAVVLRLDSHIAVTSVIDKIKHEGMKKAVVVLGQVAIMAFVLSASVLTSEMVMRFYESDLRSTNLNFLKMAYVFLQVPLSNLIIALFLLEKILASLKSNSGGTHEAIP